MPLPGEWERLAAAADLNTKQVQEGLKNLSIQVQTGRISTHDAARIHGTIFIRASRMTDAMLVSQNRLLSVVTPEGKIRWRQLLEVLPKTELTPMTFHPQTQWVGQIPPHIPITQFDRIKMPQPGISFSTELGINNQVYSDSPMILDMIWDQLEGLTHPTWTELVHYVKLPRRLEIAEVTARDVLFSHGEQTAKIRELEELIQSCQLLHP